MKLAEIFMGESGPPDPPLPPGITPQALRCHEQACKNPMSRLRGCYNQSSNKKTLRLVNKFIDVTTVGKSRSGLSSLATTGDGHPDCLLLLLLGMIGSPKLQSPDCLLSVLLLGTICRWVLFTCQGVTLSLSCCLTFTPSKSQISLLFGMAPSPGGLLLSTLPPKWAALTLTQCTQHCVPVAHLHIPHQIVTPTCFSVVFQVSSCSTHLLMAGTVY